MTVLERLFVLAFMAACIGAALFLLLGGAT